MSMLTPDTCRKYIVDMLQRSNKHPIVIGFTSGWFQNSIDVCLMYKK